MTAEHTLMLRIGALTFEIAQVTAERDRLAAENAGLRAEREVAECNKPTDRAEVASSSATAG